MAYTRPRAREENAGSSSCERRRCEAAPTATGPRCADGGGADSQQDGACDSEGKDGASGVASAASATVSCTMPAAKPTADAHLVSTYSAATAASPGISSSAVSADGADTPPLSLPASTTGAGALFAAGVALTPMAHLVATYSAATAA